eukprot:TRINITY_DN9299_c0_g1_i1.p2 TRINITY_DN9299_c0_g1~~TRINITY_DN9299_c0_g1_i1.p2  ORF type:complete len:135 (-),score=23.38 TRINITY_DN9299_c0_g1_i1:130-534(-)
MATPRLPAPLKHLLEELESPSPSIQKLPPNLSSTDDFGDYFRLKKGEELPEDKQWWQVQLRLFTAIGNCRTLRSVDLYEHTNSIGIRRVEEAEARSLLDGLQSNPVLEELDLSFWDGFETVATCVALSSILRRC